MGRGAQPPDFAGAWRPKETTLTEETGPSASRWLPLAGAYNFRDLGGYPTVDRAETRWRSLLRSDDLAQLTPTGIQALAGYAATEEIARLRD